MHKIYIDNILLPITPSNITIKIGNRNKTINLISGEEINLIKAPALQEIYFSFLLPCKNLPFAIYENGFKNPKYFINKIKNIKEKGDAFRLHIIREKSSSTVLNTTLESFDIIEDADKSGENVIVNVKFKEYKKFNAVKINLANPNSHIVSIEDNKRNKAPLIHTVKKGDCLWMIAQKYFGNGKSFKKIYADNKDLIDKGNKDTGYPIYTIYPGQKLIIKKE